MPHEPNTNGDRTNNDREISPEAADVSTRDLLRKDAERDSFPLASSWGITRGAAWFRPSVPRNCVKPYTMPAAPTTPIAAGTKSLVSTAKLTTLSTPVKAV